MEVIEVKIICNPQQQLFCLDQRTVQCLISLMQERLGPIQKEIKASRIRPMLIGTGLNIKQTGNSKKGRPIKGYLVLSEVRSPKEITLSLVFPFFDQARNQRLGLRKIFSGFKLEKRGFTLNEKGVSIDASFKLNGVSLRRNLPDKQYRLDFINHGLVYYSLIKD